jgi:SAM-dependent methyltransferase
VGNTTANAFKNEDPHFMNESACLPSGVLLEERPCPLGCAPSDEFVVEGTDLLHGIPGRFRVVNCRHCGLMRTNPRPTKDTISAYYPSSYAPYLTTATPRKILAWRHHVKARIGRALGRDSRRLPAIPPGHLVEIGCASGAYLLNMQNQGWTTEGIEFSEVAASHARSQGLRVQTSSVDAAQPPAQAADLIAAWMVLEHLHEPIEALIKIRGWIKPTGYLVGVVPDVNAFDRKLFGEYWYALQLPAHLYHFTPSSLRKLLSTAGWELQALRWQPNANNLLNSWVQWATARNHAVSLRVALWFKDNRKARTLRRWLGWALGATHQSGRMEFTARPTSGKELKS